MNNDQVIYVGTVWVLRADAPVDAKYPEREPWLCEIVKFYASSIEEFQAACYGKYGMLPGGVDRLEFGPVGLAWESRR